MDYEPEADHWLEYDYQEYIDAMLEAENERWHAVYVCSGCLMAYERGATCIGCERNFCKTCFESQGAAMEIRDDDVLNYCHMPTSQRVDCSEWYCTAKYIDS